METTNLNKWIIGLLLFFVTCNANAQMTQSSTVKDLDSFGLFGGVVKPVRSAKLSFPQQGTLVLVPEEGQMIKKGWVVAKQDDTQAKISLAEAEAALESAKLSIETAKHEQGKTERLLKENIVAPIALTETTFKLQKAEAELKIAEAKLTSSQLKLKQCQIIAPFQGVVIKVFSNLGEQNGPGNPVVEMVDLSKLEISVDMPLKATIDMKPGIRTTLLIGSRKVGKAKVKTVLPLLDPASGLRRVIWSVTEEYEMLTGRNVTLMPWKKK